MFCRTTAKATFQARCSTRSPDTDSQRIFLSSFRVLPLAMVQAVNPAIVCNFRAAGSGCSFYFILLLFFLFSVMWFDFCPSQFLIRILYDLIVYSVKRYPNFVSTNLFICIFNVTTGSEIFKATSFSFACSGCRR